GTSDLDVSLFNSAGSTNLVADVAGYYGDGTETAGSTFFAQLPGNTPALPLRLLDTRTDGGPLGPDGNLPATKDLTVGGVNGVPANAKAVVLNVTVTGATRN